MNDDYEENHALKIKLTKIMSSVIKSMYNNAWSFLNELHKDINEDMFYEKSTKSFSRN